MAGHAHGLTQRHLVRFPVTVKFTAALFKLIRPILDRVRRRRCVQTVELWRRLRLVSIPTQLVQRRLHWVGHTATLLKAWATTIKTGVEPLSGPQVFNYARWRMDWVKVSSELAQCCRAWGTYIRDVVSSICDVGDCHQEYK